MARSKKTLKESAVVEEKESFLKAFLRGFMFPIKLLLRGLAWLMHRPPFKQIGHGLRWFLTRKPIKFVARIFGLKYLYESWKELRGVTWPTWGESRRLTGAVVLFSVLFGLFVAVVDYGLDKLFKNILLK